MTDVMDRPDTTFVRWIARVFYRSENGLIDVQHDMEELEELQDLIERGPSWDAIEKIEIKRAVPSEDLITIEEARQL
ncbi:hypothetical protein [Gluconobacter oxydans]|uniref:hypothetical protein n=1 Tax=Gluconobacter oxydans TaxID=442 RepID=UPI00062C172E|nr:hypothetical protein [Gluconobacter oxydans]